MAARDQALDGLRGLAALAVAGGHSILTITGLSVWAMTYATFPGHSSFEVASRLGYLFAPSDAAVMVFFVLSGHVLWNMFHRRYAGAKSFPRCVAERLWRLLPTSVAVGALFGLASKAGFYAPIDPTELLRTMFILSRSTNGVLWSLQVEIVCSFLLFGIWVLTMGRRLPLLPIAAVSIVVYFWAGSDYALYLLPFLAGASVSLLPSRAAGSVLGLIVGLSTLVAASLFVGHGWEARLYETFGAFLLIAYARQRQPRVLTNRAVQFLGAVSYPFYLLHPLCVSLGIYSMTWIPADRLALRIVALFAFSVPYALAGAWAIHRLVERPAMRARFSRTAPRLGLATGS